MSDIRIYTAAQAQSLVPLTGDVILCTQAFNGALANSVHLCTNATGPVWKSFENDSSVTPLVNDYSLFFDGSNDFLEATSLNSAMSSIGSGDLTISMWLKIDNSAAQYDAVLYLGSAGTQADYFYCRYNNGIEFQARSGTSGYTTMTQSANTNVWYHVVFTRSGTTGILYLDNTASSPVTDSNFGVDFSIRTDNTLRIGTNRVNSAAGRIHVDEFALFNYALSESEVASLNTPSGANLVPANLNNFINNGLVAWYRMGDDTNDSPVDGGSVSGIQDSSGNGYHATTLANNQPTFSTVVPS